METWLKEGKEPPQNVLQIIVGYMNRITYPVYLGIISLYVGWNLNRTQEMMDFLTDKKIVRPANEDEKRAHSLPSCANVYVLVEPAHPSRARW